MATSLQTIIDTNTDIITKYQAALSADGDAPKSTYSLDGRMVSRNEWRAGLIDAIARLTDHNDVLLAQLARTEPFRIVTHAER